jgi:hypothetical protein
MMVILIAVITQGFTVPTESRGDFGWRLLTINDGIFQAIGVISFGMISFQFAFWDFISNDFGQPSCAITTLFSYMGL